VADLRGSCPLAVDDAVVDQRDHENGYESLALLFAERARLPPEHARRDQLRDRLISGYLPVAQHIAHKYRRRDDNREDIQQVATVGLILAIDRFDPDRGADFLSFAVPTISGEVLRHFRDRSTTIRMPRRVRELQPFVRDAAAELEQRNGRAAQPSEIARVLDVDVVDVLECLQAQQTVHCLSLDEPAWSDTGPSGRLRFSDMLGNIESEFDLIEYREAVTPLLVALPERERHILLLRFFRDMTQIEIAHQVGISQMHVSRLLTRTLTRLRRKLMAESAV
jgi:RNA polymerase sigma-B factor